MSLSHVAYRSGAVADMAGITAAVHERRGIDALGPVPFGRCGDVDLGGAGADLAVGCTYKHLNGGPGAPAFLYVRAELQGICASRSGAGSPSATSSRWAPATTRSDGIERFLVGTPASSVGTAPWKVPAISAEAGIGAIAAKGGPHRVRGRACSTPGWTPHGFALASPRDASRRGAQITLHHARRGRSAKR